MIIVISCNQLVRYTILHDSFDDFITVEFFRFCDPFCDLLASVM